VFWAFNRDEFGSRPLSQGAYAGRRVYYEGADGQYRGDAYRIPKEAVRPGDLLFFDSLPTEVQIREAVEASAVLFAKTVGRGSGQLPDRPTLLQQPLDQSRTQIISSFRR